MGRIALALVVEEHWSAEVVEEEVGEPAMFPLHYWLVLDQEGLCDSFCGLSGFKSLKQMWTSVEHEFIF